MDSEPGTTIQDELSSLFEWNPPPLSRHADAKKLCPPLILPPQSFYDKHIDEQFTLKRLVKLPSLVPDLVEKALGPLKAHIAADLPLPSVDDRFFAPAEARERYTRHSSAMIDAITVANFYQETTARACIPPACNALYLSTLSSYWARFMTWRNMSTIPDSRYKPIQEDFTLQIWDTWKNDQSSYRTAELSEAQLMLLDEVGKRIPRLATWQIFPFWKVSENIIESISDFTESRAFHHQRSGTTLSSTVKNLALNIPPDSHTQDFFLPLKRNATQRRCTRLGGSVLQNRPELPTFSFAKSRHISTTDGFIQKAWCKAVESDSTFIIFHCGSMEVIGIRHRATQTLYLSDPIDVNHCRLPGYGGIHIALYISIIEDAKDRVAQQIRAEKGSALPAGGKRKRRQSEGMWFGSRKRRRTGKVTGKKSIARRESRIFLEEASKRNLALLHFRYANYHSCSPSPLKRVAASLTSNNHHEPVDNISTSRRKYHPHQYVNIVACSYLGHGAVGKVHRAALELVTADGSTYTYDAVIKLAFSADQQGKLRYEYSIYDHLTRSGVDSGIPIILGLFEDMEGGPLVMIMNYGGRHLNETRATDNECASFRDTILAIHRAGVMHNDIRAFNLLVDGAGTATIIDFDRARIVNDRHQGSREEEVEQLVNITTGGYDLPPVGMTPSPGMYEDDGEPPLHHWFTDEED